MRPQPNAAHAIPHEPIGCRRRSIRITMPPRRRPQPKTLTITAQESGTGPNRASTRAAPTMSGHQMHTKAARRRNEAVRWPGKRLPCRGASDSNSGARIKKSTARQSATAAREIHRDRSIVSIPQTGDSKQEISHHAQENRTDQKKPAEQLHRTARGGNWVPRTMTDPERIAKRIRPPYAHETQKEEHSPGSLGVGGAIPARLARSIRRGVRE